MIKASVNKRHHFTTRGSRRGSRGLLKFAENAKSGKKKTVRCDWQHLHARDAAIIVHLLNNPPVQNQAMKEAEALYLSIPQIN